MPGGISSPASLVSASFFFGVTWHRLVMPLERSKTHGQTVKWIDRYMDSWMGWGGTKLGHLPNVCLV